MSRLTFTVENFHLVVSRHIDAHQCEDSRFLQAIFRNENAESFFEEALQTSLKSFSNEGLFTNFLFSLLTEEHSANESLKSLC